MEDWREEIWERANLFAAENGRTLIGQLGYGYDGSVFATERQSAIKVLRFQRLYERERDVYLRLRSQSIVEVAGFAVPQLIHHDDRLWVVEMGIVSPPFVLDCLVAQGTSNLSENSMHTRPERCPSQWVKKPLSHVNRK
jgi:hypothetical protein